MKTKPEIAFSRPSTSKRMPEKAVEFDAEARLNVSLPVRVHARVKVRAAEQRQTIREYILSLLEKDGILVHE